MKLLVILFVVMLSAGYAYAESCTWAITSAGSDNDFEHVMTLLKTDCKGKEDLTLALGTAATKCNDTVADYCLARGADVNKDFGGGTALFEAIKSDCSPSFLKKLLKKGAKV